MSLFQRLHVREEEEAETMIQRRKRRGDSGKSGVENPILMEEEDDDKDEDRTEDDSDDDAMTTIKTMRGKGDGLVSSMLRERDLDKFGRGREYAYANESDKDYSSVIVAKDNAYGEKYDVKFTDVNGKKTHFQMGDVLGEILPEEERRATRTHLSLIHI